MSTPEPVSDQAAAFIDEVTEMIAREDEGTAPIPREAREQAVAEVEAAMQRLTRAVEAAA
jgi:hypothetical protein